MEVEVKVEGSLHPGELLLAVDRTVDRCSGHATAQGEDLCGPSGRCHEHEVLSEGVERVDDGGGERGLTRSGRAAEDHHSLTATVGEKTGKDGQGVVLVGGRREAEVADDTVDEFIGLHRNREKLTLP